MIVESMTEDGAVALRFEGLGGRGFARVRASASAVDGRAMTSQGIIWEMFRAAQGQWPSVPLAFEAFAARCAQVEAMEGELPQEAADMYLCCACVAGEPVALRLFERQSAELAQAAISRIDSREDFVRDTLQELWRKLLVGAHAKLRSYSGRGPLAAWVRVAATRVALDRRRASKLGRERHVELSEQLAAVDSDLEAPLLRARFGRAFQDALRASVASLSKQERNVLRLHAVGRCSIDEIGRAYNVHRATAARWIERSRSKIYAEVQSALQLQHRLTASEFKSVALLIGAELEVSLGLASKPSPRSGDEQEVEVPG
jgi:RNA polymerase sigma-70 factor (ECF subfamily)